MSWSAYLSSFHAAHPGITEDTLGTARSGGVDPYSWLIEPLAGRLRGGPVLDVACGSGPLRRPVGDGWIGVDTSRAELGRADGPVILADAARLPVASSSMPALACSMALMLLQPLDDVLAEVARVLRPGGVAVAMVPGTWPLTGRDLARYAQLMAVLRRTHLAYPNDRPLRGLARSAAGVGLSTVADAHRRFALPLPDAEAGRRFVRSLYLPGVAPARLAAAGAVGASWAGGEIGVPLRRVVLEPVSRRAGTPSPGRRGRRR